MSQWGEGQYNPTGASMFSCDHQWSDPIAGLPVVINQGVTPFISGSNTHSSPVYCLGETRKAHDQNKIFGKGT